jgi:hypothetical protein
MYGNNGLQRTPGRGTAEDESSGSFDFALVSDQGLRLYRCAPLKMTQGGRDAGNDRFNPMSGTRANMFLFARIALRLSEFPKPL